MTTITGTQTTQVQAIINQPRLFSHLNGFAVLVGSIIAYGAVSGDWVAFIALLLVPDVAMVGYMMNTTIGAWLYNIVHSYALAIGVLVIGYVTGMSLIVSLGLILLAHIGMDHLFGYGYKYADAEFADTHMKRL